MSTRLLKKVMLMLPPPYRWLYDEPAPKILRAALSDYGVREFPSVKNNPVIIGWAKELGLEQEYRNDAVPWCGLAVSHWAHDAGYEIPAKPLWALSWKEWGTAADEPSLGDVLVFRRKTATGVAGHVGLYVGHDDQSFHVFAGNQSDMVCIARLARSRLVAARRSPWKIAQPSNVRPVRLAASGDWSSSEA